MPYYSILNTEINMIDHNTLTIEKARRDLDAGQYTARQLVEAHLDEIKKVDGDVHAYLEIYNDVLEQADAADKKIKAGERLPLLGIPFALKDNLLNKGKRAGSASRILEGYISPYDGTAVKKLKEAGAILVGRANMDEFAMGSSTENSAYGVTKNPHDLERVAGGSSGGSAAAVAINGALGALGSDTGGSVRQPAAFCGVVGLKPTYGSISRYGLMSLGSSLDIIGPFGKTVKDVEIIFDVLKGTDPMDSTSHYPSARSDLVKKEQVQTLDKKIGIIKGIMDIGGVDEAIKENYSDILEKLKKEDYEIVEVEIPYISLSLAVYYIIMPAEASSNLARFDGIKYGFHKEGEKLLDDYLETRGVGFGKEPRRRIILGTYVLSSGYHDAYYNKALKVRELIKKDFDKAFEKVGAIITPTTPTPAFKIGEKSNDPLSMYLADIFTVPADLTKGPAISVPSGYSGHLPLGIQISAADYREDILFEIGKVIERLR
jgi:aspartyl-tRNA(Asn)/glutamyl-tRNA(Gln) amidotransferase subunit A